jgi:hypothetical protein
MQQQPRYQPPQREGARRVSGGQNFISWKNCRPGTAYEGYFTGFSPSKFGGQNVLLEMTDGSQHTMNSSGQLAFFLTKEKVMPGTYIVVTYLGMEKTGEKARFANADAHSFDLQIIDDLDRSQEPRFLNAAPAVLAYYTSKAPAQAPTSYPQPNYQPIPQPMAPQQQPYYSQPAPAYALPPAYQPQYGQAQRIPQYQEQPQMAPSYAPPPPASAPQYAPSYAPAPQFNPPQYAPPPVRGGSEDDIPF